MAQFVQTHVVGKALLYKGYKYLKIPKDPCWKGMNIWRCKRYKSQCPASDYLWTFIEKRESALHIFHNLERKCTCSFVRVVMQRLTVDFVGSWYIGSWFCGSWSHGRTPIALVGSENVNSPSNHVQTYSCSDINLVAFMHVVAFIWKYCMFKPTVAQILMYRPDKEWWHVNTCIPEALQG